MSNKEDDVGVATLPNLVCVACDSEIQPKVEGHDEEPKDRKFLTNPDKFADLLRYFIPSENNEDIQHLFSSYKYQLPFCPDCMDCFDRMCYVEKEIETLRGVIDSLATCIKLKIQTSLGNLPTDTELNEDLVKMKVYMLGLHNLDALPELIEREKANYVQQLKSPAHSSSAQPGPSRTVMIKTGDGEDAICEIVQTYPLEEDGHKVVGQLDSAQLGSFLEANREGVVSTADGEENCPEVELEVELEGTGDSPRKSKRTIRIPSRFLHVSEGTQILLLDDNGMGWNDPGAVGGIVEVQDQSHQDVSSVMDDNDVEDDSMDTEDVEFLEEDHTEALEQEVQNIVEANKVAKKLLDASGLPSLAGATDLDALAEGIRRKKKKIKHKVVEYEPKRYEYRGHRFVQTDDGYDCLGCGKQFRVRGNVLSHIKTRHLGLSKMESNRKRMQSRKTDRRQRAVFEIQPGVFQFEGLIFRRNDDGRYQCGECNNILKTRDSALVHIKQRHLGEGLGNFLCHLCGKSFERDVYLKLHQVVHSKNARRHACNTCGKTFTHPSNLYNHKRIHSGELNHVCQFEGCDKKFLTRKQLVNHTKRQHTDDRPHHCQLCPKQFVLTSELVIHMRSHLEDRRYECHLCDSKFFIRFRLKRHLQRVHKLSVEEIPEDALTETLPTPIKILPQTTTNTITVVLEAEDPLTVKNPNELNQYITYNNLY